MAWIRQIPESDAAGVLATVYRQARQRAGGVANIIRVMSPHGESAQASMQFYVALMKTPGPLSAARREMLAAVVSHANECYY